jgi:hypothetical protein
VKQLTSEGSTIARGARSVAPSPLPSLIKGYKLRENRDIWGQDISQPDGQVGIADIDIETCALRCEARVSCVAFSFDRWNRKCYLKYNIISSLLDPRSTLAVKMPFNLPEVSKAQAKIQIVRNRRFLDTPIVRKRVLEFGKCKSACETELRCVAFTFFKNQRQPENCELFNLSNAYEPDVSADSGFKYQPP